MHDPDLPLFRWRETLATRRRDAARHVVRLRRRRAILGCALGFAVPLAVTLAAPPVPRLVWNVSASAPIGLYGVTPGAALRRGDMVAARLPAALRDLAAKRRYLPANVPLIKRVAAVPGDWICARGAWLWVNGQAAALRQPRDGQGRALSWWRGCLKLPADRYLLLMPAPQSFDGRYFGPLDRDAILGRAVTLWVR